MNAGIPTTAADSRYERSMVLLLSLSFGLVGLDRFIILPLFPVIMHDLQLDYQDLGYLSAALAFTWGLSALGMGGVIERLGTRRVLVASIAVLSPAVAGFAASHFGLPSILYVALSSSLPRDTRKGRCVRHSNPATASWPRSARSA
ncbi:MULTISPECIES: MFS transporter [Pseudomonas]|uniref:MFS transporter n=1 Tax=Pseudomonas TaxID=286 RepID=UPI002265621F|nr:MULTISPECIES: MFS transporter [Pseudomonas]MDC7816588.1 hypothetical protein [Pseudomonas sp. BLCC-B112]